MGYCRLASLILACCLTQLPALHVRATLDFHDNHLGDSNEDLRSEEDGCKETFNYKHPHHCDPTVDCTFTVKWRSVEGEEGVGAGESWVQYDVMGSLSGVNVNASSAPVWVALGFSSDSDMGDTDVVVCWHSAAGSYSIHDGYNIPDDHHFQMDSSPSTDQVQLLTEGTSIQDSRFHCRFLRKVDTGDEKEDKSLMEKHHVLAAVGLLRETESEETTMLVHVHSTASQCACNVTACDHVCSCSGGLLYQMLKMHGIVMSICFMVLLPTGSVISRYYKAVFVKAWFKAHVTTMIIGVLWSMVGLGLVLAHTRGVFSVGGHQILGLLCLALVVLQPTVGFLRPDNKPTIRRILFNIFHKSMAVTILLLTSTVVLFWGVYLFHNSVMVYMYVVLCLFILLNVGFVIGLEILKRTHKFSSSPPVGYHKVIRQEDLTESEEEEEEEVYVKEERTKKKGPAYMFEKSLLLLFVVQNLTLCGLIGAFIFYFDADSD